jgi:hypothetical protein
MLGGHPHWQLLRGVFQMRAKRASLEVCFCSLAISPRWQEEYRNPYRTSSFDFTARNKWPD